MSRPFSFSPKRKTFYRRSIKIRDFKCEKFLKKILLYMWLNPKYDLMDVRMLKQSSGQTETHMKHKVEETVKQTVILTLQMCCNPLY